jgi:hypothetical protein
MSMEINDMIAVLRAAKEGKQIQHRRATPPFESGIWINSYGGCSWDFSEYDYRVKPEPPKPREWFLVSHANNEPCSVCGLHSSRNEAATGRNNLMGVIHVREVLEENKES